MLRALVVDVIGLPDEGHPVADGVRVVVAALALWTAVLALRLGVMRRGRSANPQLLTYIAYAGSLVLISGMRVTHLGDAPTPDLWPSAAVVVCGFLGTLSSVHIHRPWRRRSHDEHER